MSVDTLLMEIEKFIVFSAQSLPDAGAIAFLAAAAAMAWIATVTMRRVIGIVAVLAEAVMVAVATLSTAVGVCLLLAVFALGR
ncbi:hypothetical protein GCM10009557_62500 [Virgisporangium ochraceum]|uniref:Uncharacterized protein n=1 Tax=Virgisporangium ochraceum TaxID=65505 RepID=A0A8J3ZMQ2_9ACTN|nr:hypothetical protein [Virgisporangium ochraceum]GIJ66887.1 hypothetical protein Voc01_018040 [Virgisporangium ochraceum]